MSASRYWRKASGSLPTGSAPSLIDLVAGQYHFNFVGMSAAQALVKGGKLRALAVTAPKRVPSYADLPAMTELVPGFEVVGWYGVMAPPKLPQPLVNKLHGELVKILKTKDIGDRILADGAESAVTRRTIQKRFIGLASQNIVTIKNTQGRSHF